MMRLLRPVFAVILSLALAASSATMAVARGQSAVAAGGQIVVICSGYGVVSITLDADGNPVGPVHPCPDCLAGIAAYIAPDVPGLPTLTLGASTYVPPALPNPTHSAGVLLTRARGPPRAI